MRIYPINNSKSVYNTRYNKNTAIQPKTLINTSNVDNISFKAVKLTSVTILVTRALKYVYRAHKQIKNIEKVNKNYDDSKGTSLVFLNSSKGKKIFKEISK